MSPLPPIIAKGRSNAKRSYSNVLGLVTTRHPEIREKLTPTEGDVLTRVAETDRQRGQEKIIMASLRRLKEIKPRKLRQLRQLARKQNPTPFRRELRGLLPLVTRDYAEAYDIVRAHRAETGQARLSSQPKEQELPPVAKSEKKKRPASSAAVKQEAHSSTPKKEEITALLISKMANSRQAAQSQIMTAFLRRKAPEELGQILNSIRQMSEKNRTPLQKEVLRLFPFPIPTNTYKLLLKFLAPFSEGKVTRVGNQITLDTANVMAEKMPRAVKRLNLGLSSPRAFQPQYSAVRDMLNPEQKRLLLDSNLATEDRCGQFEPTGRYKKLMDLREEQIQQAVTPEEYKAMRVLTEAFLLRGSLTQSLQQSFKEPIWQLSKPFHSSYDGAGYVDGKGRPVKITDIEDGFRQGHRYPKEALQELDELSPADKERRTREMIDVRPVTADDLPDPKDKPTAKKMGLGGFAAQDVKKHQLIARYTGVRDPNDLGSLPLVSTHVLGSDTHHVNGTGAASRINTKRHYDKSGKVLGEAPKNSKFYNVGFVPYPAKFNGEPSSDTAIHAMRDIKKGEQYVLYYGWPQEKAEELLS